MAITKNHGRRPSDIGNIKDCPHFGYKVDKASTESGTDLHHAYETGDMTGLTDIEVSYINTALLITSTAIVKLSNEFGGAPVLEEKEQKVFSPKLNMGGTLDRRLLCGRIAIIMDLKSGRKGIPSLASQNVQIKCYAVATFEELATIEEVRGILFNPRTGDRSDDLVIKRADLEAVYAEIEALIEKSMKRFAIPTPGEHCARCGNAAECWVMHKEIVQLAKSTAPQFPLAMLDPTAERTPVQWAFVKAYKAEYDNWSEQFDDAFKAWLAKNPDTPVPGFKKVNSSTGVKLPADKTEDAITKLRDMGIKDAEILGACTINLKELGNVCAVPRSVSVEKMTAQIKETLKDLTFENKFSYYRRDDKSLKLDELVTLVRTEIECQQAKGVPQIQ